MMNMCLWWKRERCAEGGGLPLPLAHRGASGQKSMDALHRPGAVSGFHETEERLLPICLFSATLPLCGCAFLPAHPHGSGAPQTFRRRLSRRFRPMACAFPGQVPGCPPSSAKARPRVVHEHIFCSHCAGTDCAALLTALPRKNGFSRRRRHISPFFSGRLLSEIPGRKDDTDQPRRHGGSAPGKNSPEALLQRPFCRQSYSGRPSTHPAPRMMRTKPHVPHGIAGRDTES